MFVIIFIILLNLKHLAIFSFTFLNMSAPFTFSDSGNSLTRTPTGNKKMVRVGGVPLYYPSF